LEVGDNWLAQLLVTLSCQIKRSRAIWVLLECGDAVANDWVGVQVLQKAY
jgi:hypothetical protein